MSKVVGADAWGSISFSPFISLSAFRQASRARDRIECLHHTENNSFSSLGLEGLQSELQKLIMP